MANECNFSMIIKGTTDQCDLFLAALQQKDNIYMGRGACIEAIDPEEDGEYSRIQCDGWCKWSIKSALINNACDMRTNPKNWGFDVNKNKLTFITLIEACKIYNVECEVYSEEPGFQFQEHYLIKKKCDDYEVTEECVNWSEVDVSYYREIDNRNTAESKLGRDLTDEEWETADYISYGGFENWDFNI